MEKTIFISFCGKNKLEVDEIDASFSKDGVKLTRYDRESRHQESIKEFMKKVRLTDYVLMIISDEFLKSQNCMYEVLEVLKDDNYQKRLFTIVLPNAYQIYSPGGALTYSEFWMQEHKELQIRIEKFPPDQVIEIRKDLAIIRNIGISICEFVKNISDLINIPFDDLKKNDFEDIKHLVGVFSKAPSVIHYDILKLEDVSHAGAKRYAANILIESKYSKEEIKQAIKEIIGILKKSLYYRDEKVRECFGDASADVIWLFIAHRMVDVDNCNWTCRAYWVSPSLSEEMRPIGLSGNDSIGDIVIDWNDHYETMAEFYYSHSIPKDKFLERVDFLIKEIEKLIFPLFKIFSASQMTNNYAEVISYTNTHQARINELYTNGTDIPNPPHDCIKFDELVQSYFAQADNLFLIYSTKGLDTWEENNRKYLMKKTIEDLSQLEDRIIMERKGL